MKPLHTKYRPKTFDDMVGNEYVLFNLKNALEEKSHPHVFLIHGMRGSGKTSLAYVLANELDCEQVDYYNVANERGIDTAREIIDSARYRPFKGKNKMYIIDEFHQTQVAFQNALLNILEETPEHAYFCICTTNPEKIIETIKDRCYAVEVKPLSKPDGRKLLDGVMKKEKRKPVSEKVFNAIYSSSEGRPRAMLIFLNKFLSLKGDEELTSELLQIEDEAQAQVNLLCQALMNKESWKRVKGIITTLLKQDATKDPESIRRMILGYFSAVALNQDEPNKRLCLLFECFKDNYYNTGKSGLTFSCQYATLQ